jgi:hypothetical protein
VKHSQLSNVMDRTFRAEDTAQNVHRKIAHVVHWMERGERQISESTESSPLAELLNFRDCDRGDGIIDIAVPLPRAEPYERWNVIGVLIIIFWVARGIPNLLKSAHGGWDVFARHVEIDVALPPQLRPGHKVRRLRESLQNQILHAIGVQSRRNFAIRCLHELPMSCRIS